MGDMHQTIVPKSDQLNADDLIGRELTIKITGVDIKGGQEQPVSIHFEGDNGKPYKACKSMCRVMVSAWGPDSKKYVGRSMTIYRDPKVKWGGMEVGGIRISHMSDIDEDMTMALTVTRANKKPFTVRRLNVNERTAGGTPPPTGSPEPVAAASGPSAISDKQHADLLAILSEVPNGEARFKRAAKLERLTMLAADKWADAIAWAEKARAGA